MNEVTNITEDKIVNRKYPQLKAGMVFKNYKELCTFLNEKPVTGGNNQKKQFQKWEETDFKYEKEGHKIIITQICPNITEEDLIMEHGGFAAQNMLKTENKLTPALKKQFRQKLYSFMDYEVVKRNQYIIKEVYEQKRPVNIAKMQKGIYQYLIPAILQKINESPNNEMIITVHNLALQIEMINKNNDIILKNKSILTKDDATIKETEYFNTKNFNDYFDRMNSTVRYFIKKSIDLLDEGKVIRRYHYLTYVREINKKTRQYLGDREATKDEMLALNWIEDSVMEEMNIMPEDLRECYYGSKAKEYSEIYQKFLDEYNESRTETEIQCFYTVYHIFGRNSEMTNNVMNLFNQENLVEKLNQYLYNHLYGLEEDRYERNNMRFGLKHKYDYNTLLSFGIFAGLNTVRITKKDGNTISKLKEQLELTEETNKI